MTKWHGAGDDVGMKAQQHAASDGRNVAQPEGRVAGHADGAAARSAVVLISALP